MISYFDLKRSSGIVAVVSIRYLSPNDALLCMHNTEIKISGRVEK